MEKSEAALLEMILDVHKEIQIAAPMAIVFESLLEQMGPESEWPNGQKMDFKIEPWPGGRWYRDLGNKAGHLWGHVQVIKPPNLLEITGPLFMSYPAMNHIQYRLTAEGDGTKLTFAHRGMGEFPPEVREGVSHGWESILASIKKRSQR